MEATCSICGQQWDSRDPGVNWWRSTDTWECADEIACFARADRAREDNETKGTAVKPAGKVNMNVARPAYARLMTVKAALTVDRGRDVTNDETLEALLSLWETSRRAEAGRA